MTDQIKGVRHYIRPAFVVDAIQWFGNNLDDIRKFCDPNDVYACGPFLYIKMNDADEPYEIEVNLLDYIIINSECELWSYQREYFQKVFVEVNE